jgi:AmmeMemoRadiSam system protein A
MISDVDRVALLHIAREALAARTSGQPPPNTTLAGALARPGAAFVTLHRHGDLRGCIGHLEVDEPLGLVVARCAIAAGTSDPRFLPVTAHELPALDIEISILGPLEEVSDAGDVEIGRHGLFVEMDADRGLLLPQVASEWRWDAETFIAQTCVKAGLSRDAWKKGARLWRFEAEVFGEAGAGSPGGATDRAAPPGSGRRGPSEP